MILVIKHSVWTSRNKFFPSKKRKKKEKKEEKKERIASFYPFESKSSPPPLPAFSLEKE